MYFKDSVKDLPLSGVFAVRVVDDVLDEDDWTVDLLEVSEGIVIKQTTFLQGIYIIPDMIGWNTSQIEEWSRYESPIGIHPQEWHQVMTRR